MERPVIRPTVKQFFLSVFIALLTLGCASTTRYALPPPPEEPAIIVDDPICVSCHLEEPVPAPTDRDAVPDASKGQASAILAFMLPPNHSFKPTPLRGAA